MTKWENACSQQIYSAFNYHQCSRSAKVCRDGVWFCAQHDPEAVKARMKKRDEKWDAETKARHLEWAKRDADKKIVSAAIEQFHLGVSSGSLYLAVIERLELDK